MTERCSLTSRERFSPPGGPMAQHRAALLTPRPTLFRLVLEWQASRCSSVIPDERLEGVTPSGQSAQTYWIRSQLASI